MEGETARETGREAFGFGSAFSGRVRKERKRENDI
jgi:hypothetical protein